MIDKFGKKANKLIENNWHAEFLPLFDALPAEKKNVFEPEINDFNDHVLNLLKNLIISGKFTTLHIQRSIVKAQTRFRELLCTEIPT